ncbi:MAG: aspartyl protease family protein [Proteobacteria bacterium]|nr:aspartyl protease family protein [Pseudomonadota bacterium]
MSLSNFRNACVLILAALCTTAAHAQAQAADANFDPVAVLGAAKAATGGSTWNDFSTQHSKVTLSTSGLSGPVERWSEFKTGRSWLSYSLGPISGVVGFDGKQGWTREGSAPARLELGRTQRELAVNTAYRDQLAFWFPERHAARIVAKGRETRDGASFYVIGITPEGGREFDLWINTDTNLIERLVEHEATATRTEYYMDFRDVSGVKIPYRVRASRGDTRYDEIVTVDTIAFDQPDGGVSFSPPPPPQADFAFPAGKPSVDVPFTVLNGHLYLDVKLNGKGPFLMMFDAGGSNVILPETLKALAVTPPAAAGDAAPAVTLDALDIGGVRIDKPAFVVAPLAEQLTRIEGVDKVAGIVGYEVFRRMPVRIDYAKGVATLYDPATFRYTGTGAQLSLQFREQIPTVDGSLDGIDGVFAIDTGARTSLTLTRPFADNNNLAAKYHADGIAVIGAGVGGPLRAELARADTLKLGTATVTKPVTLLATATAGPLADPSLAGNVGYGVLRRFNLVFDYPHQMLWLEPNASDAEPDVYDRAGMWIERTKDGIRVVDVMEQSPASDAGVPEDSVITAIDGTPVRNVSLDEFRKRLKAAPGTKVKLTDKAGKSYVLTLRDLV